MKKKRHARLASLSTPLLSLSTQEAGPDAVAPLLLQPLPAALTSPYLDVAAALERISGLSALYVEIAGEFVHRLDGVEADFRRAALEQCLPALVAQMHMLKGTAGTLGADLLSKHAESLEALLRRAEPGLLPLEHLPALLELLAATRSATLQAIACLTRKDTACSAGRSGGAVQAEP